MRDWQEEYKKKLISAEEAAKFVKSGHCVAFTIGKEAYTLGAAIARRKEELEGVKILVPIPVYDFGWYNAGWEKSFEVSVAMPTAVCQQMVDERRCDICKSSIIPQLMEMGSFTRPDILLVELSPPDDKGFCSFGTSVWDKKEQIRNAKLVIAEVNKNLIRTFGDNYIHISEIDYFVEHVSSGKSPGGGSLGGRGVKETEPYLKQIKEHVSGLIKDGDTIQIGIGRTTEPLVRLGLLDGKNDLGYHSEATPPGIITAVKAGIINGKRKTLNPEKVVVTSIGGSSKEEMEWVNDNPLFYLVGIAYLEDIRIIAAHENMVAINNALSIDLTGQICAETIGGHVRSAAGGQIAFAYGALMSKGGRSITVLPSTARGGKVSRIVPALESGATVTIQSIAADYIVTEYGVAKLKGKTIRERTQELISIAHPNFREELKREAKRLYWP